jgi:hypothetical protein
MIEKKVCPKCGTEIAFSYVRPDYIFDIIDGKIERDENQDLWIGKDPYLEFYCGGDRTHNLEHIDPHNEKDFILWTETVEREFYEKIFPDL